MCSPVTHVHVRHTLVMFGRLMGGWDAWLANSEEEKLEHKTKIIEVRALCVREKTIEVHCGICVGESGKNFVTV